MAFCTKCGFEIIDSNVRFCPMCGTAVVVVTDTPVVSEDKKLEPLSRNVAPTPSLAENKNSLNAFCSNCGKGLKDGAWFCNSCGAVVGAKIRVPRKILSMELWKWGLAIIGIAMAIVVGKLIGKGIDKMSDNYHGLEDRAMYGRSAEESAVDVHNGQANNSAKAVNQASDRKLSVITDARDGQTYRAVQIGDHVWMAENLRYKVSGSECYNEDESKCQQYGRLYNWQAANSACPDGWHLSSRQDWNNLINAIGGQEVAGEKLKSTHGWYNNYNGTDSYQFSALPGGVYIPHLGFSNIGIIGVWWTDIKDKSGGAYCRYMYNYNDVVDEQGKSKNELQSVRCVAGSPQASGNSTPIDLDEDRGDVD